MKILRYRNLPLAAYLGYAVFVVLCLLIGPVRFEGIGYGLLLGFLLLYLVLFSAGYLLGARGDFNLPAPERSSNALNAYARSRRLIGFVLYSAVVYSLYSWAELFLASGAPSLSSIGERYSEYYSGYERGQATIDVSYVVGILVQAVVMVAILLGIANFRVMERSRRLLVLFVVASYVLVNLLYAGKQKYLGDIVVFIAAAAAISMAANRARFSFLRVTKYAVAAVLVLAVFAEILLQRYSFKGIGIDSIAGMSHPLVIWDVNSPFVQVLGDEYGFAFGYVLFYFSNGLYGLYLTLSLPFEWSFFAGSSYSLGRIVEILVGEPGMVLHSTYPYRAGESFGWGLEKWHSAFAWVASDVGFTGVLLLTPVLSWFIAKVWRESVNSTNAASAPLFLYMTLGLAFSFANNQLVHAMSGLMVLVFLLVFRRRDARSQRRRRPNVSFTNRAG